jgi:hypothetical protein
MIELPEEESGVTRGGALGGAGQPANNNTQAKSTKTLPIFSCGRAERTNMRCILLTKLHRTRSNRFLEGKIDWRMM